MTRAGRTLADVPDGITWAALRSFVSHLDASSALVSEMHPDMAGWQGASRVPAMLADLYDLMAAFRAEFAQANGGKRRKPKPYPRPWARRKDEQRVGRDPIPIRDFEGWWNDGR